VIGLAECVIAAIMSARVTETAYLLCVL